jgi:hypothetical protein
MRARWSISEDGAHNTGGLAVSVLIGSRSYA